MHSIWQEKIDFPSYPILKRDKKCDILYLGATLQNAVEAHFRQKQGAAVMMLEEKIISQMPELGGMGILRARDIEERRNLHRIRDYILGRGIPCEMEIISEDCLWVHPVKLFLFMTEGIDVYEQTSVCSVQGKRLDIGSAYVDAGEIVEPKEKKDPLYVYVFQDKSFYKIPGGDMKEIRRYKDVWLVGSPKRDLEGAMYSWEI